MPGGCLDPSQRRPHLLSHPSASHYLSYFSIAHGLATPRPWKVNHSQAFRPRQEFELNVSDRGGGKIPGQQCDYSPTLGVGVSFGQGRKLQWSRLKLHKPLSGGEFSLVIAWTSRDEETFQPAAVTLALARTEQVGCLTTRSRVFLAVFCCVVKINLLS